MKLRLNNVRLAFPNIFEPQVSEDGKASYGATVLLDPNDPQIKAINATIEAVAKEKWTSKADVMLKQIRAADKTALHNGDTKAQYAGFEGTMFVSARNPVRPTALDADKTPLQATDGRIYAGCYVNAVLEFWAQDNGFGKRVNATLMGVQFFRDGDAFSGGGAASNDDFDDVTSGAESGDFV